MYVCLASKDLKGPLGPHTGPVSQRGLNYQFDSTMGMTSATGTQGRTGFNGGDCRARGPRSTNEPKAKVRGPRGFADLVGNLSHMQKIHVRNERPQKLGHGEACPNHSTHHIFQVQRFVAPPPRG